MTVFAPIALIQSYGTVEEAIEIANGTKYGLGASVFGPDQTYAIQVAKQIKCGMVSVNDFGVFYVCSLGFSCLMSLLTSNLAEPGFTVWWDQGQRLRAIL